MSGAMQAERTRVKVTAVDCNLALWPEAETFDGSPFSEMPRWLVNALGDGRLRPHTRGGTDYAQWEVKTPAGIVNAQPGDEIDWRGGGDGRGGELRVYRYVRTELKP